MKPRTNVVRAWAKLENGQINPCDIFKDNGTMNLPCSSDGRKKWILVEIRPISKKGVRGK